MKLKKKSKKKESLWVENENENSNLLALKRFVIGVITYLSGIPYIILWMNTKFYNHNYEFFHQPYLLHAIGLPALIISILWLTNSKIKNIFNIGEHKFGEVIMVFVISYFCVASVLATYIIGLIILGFFGLVITKIF